MRSLKECREILIEYNSGPIVASAAKDVLAHANKLAKAALDALDYLESDDHGREWRDAVRKNFEKVLTDAGVRS